MALEKHLDLAIHSRVRWTPLSLKDFHAPKAKGSRLRGGYP